VKPDYQNFIEGHESVLTNGEGSPHQGLLRGTAGQVSF
jgi:hypothetical protein